MSQLETEDPKFHVFCQLLAAFGQGAGTVNITSDAMSRLITIYWPVISRQTDLNTTLLQALEYARGLGRLASHHALSNGFNLVRVDDFDYAAETLSAQTIAPLQDCPYC